MGESQGQVPGAVHRTLSVEVPFARAEGFVEVYWARAIIETPAGKSLIDVAIAGTDEAGFNMTENDRQEARALLALVTLAELPAEALTPLPSGGLRVVPVPVPHGPGPKETWTIDTLRVYARDRLRAFEITNKGSTRVAHRSATG